MPNDKVLFYARVGSAVLILALAVYVVLQPGLVYAPVPRNILFFLVAILPAILFATEAAARLRLQVPGLVITAAGAAGVIFVGLYFLNAFSKPEAQIAVYEVVTERGQPVPLDVDGALRIRSEGGGGVPVAHFIDGNVFVVVYPEQVPRIRVRVQPVVGTDAPVYGMDLTYAGTRKEELVLGSDLLLIGSRTED